MSSRILQVILGFFLGVFLLSSGLGVLGFILWSRFSITPSKPMFAEEKKIKTSPKPKLIAKKQPPKEIKKSPTPKETPTPDSLPPGAYKARVSWSEGLSVRSGPSRENERSGGIEYNEEVIVLEKNSDQTWLKVRSVNTQVEGWVRSGNISGQETAEAPLPQKPTKTQSLPQGTYKAKVRRSGGLTIRSGPSRQNESVGGVGYNDELIVIEKDADGVWVKVRSPQTGLEGWVRSSNLSTQE